MQDNKRKSEKGYIIFFIILFLFISVIVCNYIRDTETTEKISYNNFIKLLDEKQISKVVITSEFIIITPNENNSQYKEKTLYTANVHDENLLPKLEEAKVDFEGKNEKTRSNFDFIFYYIIPLGSVFLIWKNICLKKENQKLLNQIKDLSENNDKHIGFDI